MFKHSLCVVAACLLVSATGYVRVQRGKIVGGQDTDISKVPYQLALWIEGMGFLCGAVLIGEKSALTAAHCILSYPQDVKLSAGSNTNTHTDYKINVARIVVHPKYILSSINENPINDIAYLEFVSPLTFTDKIQPAKLPSRPPVVGSSAVVSGWGNIQHGGPSPETLQSVEVQIIEHQKCKIDYRDTIYKVTDDMVCANVPEGGKGSCHGDSGGPLVVDGELVGIVSWSKRCASPLYPGVYADVFYFLNWIKEQLGH